MKQKKAQTKTKKNQDENKEVLKPQENEFEEKYRRALADYRNLERRVREDREKFIKLANADLIERLLEPLDFMEQATEHIDDQGVQMVVDRFWQVLQDEGLKEIDSLGKEFDEKTMECVENRARGKGQRVIEVKRKGYFLNGVLLRPARVVVG